MSEIKTMKKSSECKKMTPTVPNSITLRIFILFHAIPSRIFVTNMSLLRHVEVKSHDREANLQWYNSSRYFLFNKPPGDM